MTIQLINLGTSPNRGDGDPLRIAFDKINDNFTELYETTALTSETAQQSLSDIITNGVQENITVSYNETDNVIEFSVPNTLSSYINDTEFLANNSSDDIVFNSNLTVLGNIIVAGDLVIQSSVPVTSKGQVLDTQGAISVDSTYIYYCVETYTTGEADIWKRIAWSTDTW